MFFEYNNNDNEFFWVICIHSSTAMTANTLWLCGSFELLHSL